EIYNDQQNCDEKGDDYDDNWTTV
uniref:Uncharacterized protein n=1 Tax=Romanomermis culicivorax TaxID=13658 RepID=A0A915LAY6_ROMCU